MLTPLLGVFTPWLGYDTPRFVGVLIIGALVLPMLTSRIAAAVNPDARPLLIGLVVLAGAFIVSSALADWPSIALLWGNEYSAMSLPVWITALVVLAAAALMTSRRSAAQIVQAGALAGAVLAAWGLYDLIDRGFAGGGLGNGNYLGAVLVLTWPLLPAAELTIRNPQARQVLRVATLGVIAMVFASGSSAASLVLTVQVLVIAVFLPQLLGVVTQGGRRALRWAAAAVTAAGVSIVGAAFVPGVLPQGVETALREAFAGGTAATRLEMWSMAWATWLDHPLVGVGPDGFALASQQHLTEALSVLEGGTAIGDGVLVRDPHSLPLLLLASFGVVGIVAIVGTAYAWGRLLVRRLRDDQSAAFTVRAFVAIAVAGFLACLLLMPATIRFGLMPVVLLGVAVSDWSFGAGTGTNVTPTLRRTATVAAVGFAGVLVVIATMALVGQIHLERSEDARSAAARLEALDLAAQAQPGRALIPLLRARIEGELLITGAISLDEYRGSLAEIPDVTLAVAPYRALIAERLLDHAWLAESDQALEQGAALAEQAMRMAPNAPQVVIEGAHAALLTGDHERAAELLDRTAALGSTSTRIALYQYGILRAQGQDAAAAALGEEIRARAPEFSLFLVP